MRIKKVIIIAWHIIKIWFCNGIILLIGGRGAAHNRVAISLRYRFDFSAIVGDMAKRD